VPARDRRAGRVCGGEVESALVTRLLNDIGGNPDQLPLLQHVLMLLWRQARERGGTPLLALADYERLGGIGGERSAGAGAAGLTRSNGALSDHADRVWEALTAEQKRLTETMFRALIDSEGVIGRDTRRPTELGTIAGIAGAPVEAVRAVVEAFRAPGVNFLTPSPPAPLNPDMKIDISHESLIRQWVKLREWVRREYQSAEEYRHIEHGAKQWKNHRGNLLSRLDLLNARQWRTSENPNSAWAKRYGDDYGLAMEFLRKSEISRFRRRGLVAAAVAIPVMLLAGAAWITSFAVTVAFLALAYVNPGDEAVDYGIDRRESLRQGTPTAISDGKIIKTLDLQAALERKRLEGLSFKLIDVLEGKHDSIAGSIPLPFAGSSGHFQDDVQNRLEDELRTLTGNNLEVPLVFYCNGSMSWLSYNASLRP